MIRYQITDGEVIDPAADYVQIRPGRLKSVREAMLVHPRVLVNDRADIALALGAAGVHLKSNSVSVARLRAIVPAGFLISIACHSLADAIDAQGADFALVSPVFPPLSKADLRPALGLDALREICRRSPVPVLALGGVTKANAELCVQAGAAGVAGISLFSARA